jgi:hypothetical protein
VSSESKVDMFLKIVCFVIPSVYTYIHTCIQTERQTDRHTICVPYNTHTHIDIYIYIHIFYIRRNMNMHGMISQIGHFFWYVLFVLLVFRGLCSALRLALAPPSPTSRQVSLGTPWQGLPCPCPRRVPWRTAGALMV